MFVLVSILQAIGYDFDYDEYHRYGFPSSVIFFFFILSKSSTMGIINSGDESTKTMRIIFFIFLRHKPKCANTVNWKSKTNRKHGVKQEIKYLRRKTVGKRSRSERPVRRLIVGAAAYSRIIGIF